jgi:hypothetical protein
MISFGSLNETQILNDLPDYGLSRSFITPPWDYPKNLFIEEPEPGSICPINLHQIFSAIKRKSNKT